jgi:hypothetical protein
MMKRKGMNNRQINAKKSSIMSIQDDDSLMDFGDENREINVFDHRHQNTVKVERLPKTSEQIDCAVKPGYQTSNP